MIGGVEIQKYLGKYTLFYERDLSKNKDVPQNTYLKGRYSTEIYRFNKDTLAIIFVSNQTVNNLLPQFKKIKVRLDLFAQGDAENIYLFKENDLDKLHSILKIQIRGKNEQLKEAKEKAKTEKKNKKK